MNAETRSAEFRSAETRSARLSRVTGVSLLVGVAASALCVFGYLREPAHFFPAYLVAFLLFVGMSLGCLAIAMIHHLTGGGWGIPIRRVLEAGYSVLPLLAVLFLPILLGMDTLYSWSRTSAAADPILAKKAAYLNVEWFQVRAAAYFIGWILLGLALNRLSSGADAANEPRRARRLALLSGPGLILWAAGVTFASIDWAMSLEPHWFSTSYGVLFMGGQAVSAMSLAILASALLRDVPPWRDTLSIDRMHDLGNFLLAAVLFWTYIAFTQFLIVWSGNLPEETPFYVARSLGPNRPWYTGWQPVALLLSTLHFLVPFLLLLARHTKRSPRWLVGIACLLLLMRLVDLTWLVMPAFSPDRFSLHWLNFVTPLAVGGLWLAAFSWRLSARADLPVYDPAPIEESEHELAHAAH